MRILVLHATIQDWDGEKLTNLSKTLRAQVTMPDKPNGIFPFLLDEGLSKIRAEMLALEQAGLENYPAAQLNEEE